ncbi:hypothetical protein [Jeotgalicoccus sp. ATCC 8456]|uniref:hypothetical protein n=1 Tax=Jeotgalicoccus sp. ATCC 8456 TaxID=946435 RepID=UPI0018E62A6C|nr:hypothetical protein [Jeotgalicoccus sp. ATCC 8456]QQD85676.1 hypothetical protein JEM45_03360 [Jeotgalicoccus sp. ATCC 8456]
MAFKYLLSSEKNNRYNFSSQLNDEFILNYDNEEFFTEANTGSGRMICYGFCFDVRNPENSTEDTIKKILNNKNFNETVGYLNGQFILFYIDKNNNLYSTIDATSLIPVYIDKKLSIISTDEIENFKIFNPNYILNLTNKSLQRITVAADLTDQALEDYVLSLLGNQYKYFSEQNLILNYKTNKYLKALVSVMKPKLYNNYMVMDDLAVEENDHYFAKSLSSDFSMKLVAKEDIKELSRITFLRNQLFDYEQFLKENDGYNNEDFLLDESFSAQPKYLQHVEINIISRKRAQSKVLTETGLLFDPFNVHAIYQTLFKNKAKNSNIITSVTQTLLPSLNFYDFNKGYDLKQVNQSLLEQIDELKLKQITADNEQFLLDTKMSFFNVSDNVDGKLSGKEIIIYPASQSIQKGEKFYVSYENPGDGMIFIKSFFKNKKNGQTIEVTINKEKYTIDQLSKGIHLHVQSKLNVRIQYKNSRNSLPWQKAGTLLIREK